jgi:hypothetical protein
MTNGTPGAIDRALARILAEVHEGLRHGYFEFVLTCEVIGQERRRLTLKAGKNHQYVIPKEECLATGRVGDSGDRSANKATAEASTTGTVGSSQARTGASVDSEPLLPNGVH